MFGAAVMLTLAVDLFQNSMPFGSQERIDFYFTQKAYCEAIFALCLNYFIKNKLSMFWLWYCVGELINEVFFNGSLSYIELITGVIALFYVVFFIKK